MVSRTVLWRALCASLILLNACDDGKKSGGTSNEQDSGQQGDGDHMTGDGDGDDPRDGGCVYCDGGPDGAIIDLPEGSVGGFVFSSANPPVPLAGVRIVGPGDKTTTTGADGFFTLTDLPTGEGVLRAERDDYTHALRPVTVQDQSSVYLELFLKNMFKKTIDPTKGGGVKDKDSGGGVIFAADSFKRKDGSAPKGGATVSIVAVSESKAKAGSEKGNDATQSGVLKGGTPVEVRVIDTDGEKLQISDGKEAEVTFPVSSKAANPPSQVDLYYLDEKDGVWKKEGEPAVKTKDEEGKAVYKGKIKHMSWWTADVLVPAGALTCVRACVKQGDSAVGSAGASVVLGAIKDTFSANLNADASGCFALNLPPNVAFSAVASGNYGSSSVLSFTSSGELKTVEAGKDACTDLGTIALVAPQATGPRCPAGFALCDDKCVDVRNDSEQCGTSCGNLVACTENGPSHSVCLNGACRCPPGFTQCGTQCIDLKNDPQQCGSSCSNYTACNGEDGKTCVNGVCDDLVCAGGTTLSYEWFGDTQYPTAVCVDTQNDVMNCGSVFHRCDPYLQGDPSPRYTCEQGTCGCAQGTTACMPESESTVVTCVDALTDIYNCGGCGSVQGILQDQHLCDYYTEACVNGTCQPIECAAGKTLCYGGCVDLASDANHCGSCDFYCEGQNLTCENSTCVNFTCGAPLVACYNQCIPPDPYNCGACGLGCADGYGCILNAENQANCTQLDCAAEGKTQCDSHSCSDLQTDEFNCGGCGNHCLFGTCVAGECTCASDQQACGSGSYIVCTDLNADCLPAF